MELLEMLAGSAALFIGNIRVGLGAATGNGAVEAAVADAIVNAFGDEKTDIKTAKSIVEKRGYMIENISIICEGMQPPKKSEITSIFGEKIIVGISSIDSKNKKVTAQVYLVKKAITLNEKKEELSDKTHYI